MVLFQQRNIHTRLSVKAVHKGFGHQKTQILIALAIFAQQHQVIGIVVYAVDPVAHSPAGHIDLAADDRLYAGSLGSLIKVDTAVHNAVVGNGNSALAQFLDPIHYGIDAASTVQEAIFRMHM